MSKESFWFLPSWYTKDMLSKLKWGNVDLNNLRHWRLSNLKTGYVLDVLRFRYDVSTYKTLENVEPVRHVKWRAVTSGGGVYKLYPKLFAGGIMLGLALVRIVQNDRERDLRYKHSQENNESYKRGIQFGEQRMTGWGRVKEDDITKNLHLIEALAVVKSQKEADEKKKVSQEKLAEVARQFLSDMKS